MTIPRTEWIWFGLACAVGLLAAIVGLHTDDLQFAVLFLFVNCAVFGYARPERAWRWAILVAIWIPLSLLLNMAVTMPSPRSLGIPARLFLGPVVAFLTSPVPVTMPTVTGCLPAFFPALAGAYAGAWMNRLAAPARATKDSM
jgi:hypothetical protein